MKGEGSRERASNYILNVFPEETLKSSRGNGVGYFFEN